jgi:hypothetical protein
MYLSSTTTRQYIVEVSRLVQKFFNENGSMKPHPYVGVGNLNT